MLFVLDLYPDFIYNLYQYLDLLFVHTLCHHSQGLGSDCLCSWFPYLIIGEPDILITQQISEHI